MKQLLQINIKSFDKTILNIYTTFLINMFNNSNIKFSFVGIPIKKKRITLLKSPHVHKKAREQFELRVYTKKFFVVNIKQFEVFTKVLINKPKLITVNIKYLGK
jgi:small subunit ribosomal protein S10